VSGADPVEPLYMSTEGIMVSISVSVVDQSGVSGE
jgi:hypothetical protein